MHAQGVQLFVTPWIVARHPSLFMEFFRQEYGSRLPFPIPGDLPNPVIKPKSLVAPALAGGFLTTLPPVSIFSWHLYTGGCF